MQRTIEVTLTNPTAQQPRPLELLPGDQPLWPRRILFPVDLSQASASFVPHVMAIARTFGSSVTLLNLNTTHKGREAASGIAMEFLDDDAIGNVEVANGNGDDDAAVAIVGTAAGQQSDLIMLPSKRRGFLSRLWTSSLAEKVVRGTKCPVWVDRNPRQEWNGVQGIVCAVSLSSQDRKLLSTGAFLAGVWGTSLSIIHAIPNADISALQLAAAQALPPTYSPALAAERIDRLQEQAGTEAEVRIIQGDVAKGIGRCRTCQSASLLLVGANRTSYASLGPTTRSVLESAPCPVLAL